MESKRFLVTEVRGKITTGCNGMDGYDAEACIELDTGEEVFANASICDGNIVYALTDKSVFDYVTGESEERVEAETLEMYESLEEAEESDYYRVFEGLKTVIKMMDA